MPQKIVLDLLAVHLESPEARTVCSAFYLEQEDCGGIGMCRSGGPNTCRKLAEMRNAIRLLEGSRQVHDSGQLIANH